MTKGDRQWWEDHVKEDLRILRVLNEEVMAFPERHFGRDNRPK